jgi:thiopurine S-methyltransferase
MDHAFWHSRWQNQQIGFHLDQANPLLVGYFHHLGLNAGQCIVVPLCGKSLDIPWLLAQGLQVVGIELSPLAVQALFQELALTPEITPIGALTCYHAGPLTVFNGDFFALSQAQLHQANINQIDAVYDRAALVALPADMRLRYRQHLANLTAHAKQLLVSFDYDQSLQAGPPFSVDAQAVEQLYAKDFTLSLLADVALEGGLKGKCPAQEQVWLLQARER